MYVVLVVCQCLSTPQFQYHLERGTLNYDTQQFFDLSLPSFSDVIAKDSKMHAQNMSSQRYNTCMYECPHDSYTFNSDTFLTLWVTFGMHPIVTYTLPISILTVFWARLSFVQAVPVFENNSFAFIVECHRKCGKIMIYLKSCDLDFGNLNLQIEIHSIPLTSVRSGNHC